MLRKGMRVRVLLFGVLKDIFERSEDVLELSAGATAGDLLDHYQKLVPAKANFFHSIALAVNQQYASPAEALHDGDEIALLPPVSGGSTSAVLNESYHCEIVREPIATGDIINRIKQREDGAVAVFEGIVRNHTRIRQTLYLDYEAY